MDAYQQHHRYMRPPQPPPAPASTADPHLYPHHQQTRPPVPPQGTWYSNQFQYHPPPPLSSSHSPSPPPQQWGPPPHSDHLAHPPPPPPPPPPPGYPPPAPHPYPTHLPPQNHPFLPPPPPPPPPHAPPQIPQSYPQVNQEWGNPNWGQHQGWDYQAQNNVEDWAARARAWAAAKKVAMEDQHLQSQFTPVGRPEEQIHVHEQYPQAVDSYYQDIQQQPFPASGYQQFPGSAAPPHQPPIVYSQETASFNSGQPSYVPDGRQPYTGGSGTSAGASTTSPSVLEQEVPSSYSSVTGKEEIAEQKQQPYKSLPLLISSSQERQHHMQPSLPFAYGSQAADPTTDLSDQPLDFVPSFNRDHGLHVQSSFAAHHDSVGAVGGIGPVTSVPSWTPAVATGAVYPSIPPVLPSGPQHDPSVAVPSPVPGPAAPPFGSFPGSSFQSTIASTGAPYSLVTGSALHPATGFPGDSYGVSNVSERPKKASVPNWLKEEIIKNASVITRSSMEHPKEETQSIEEEGVDKSFGKSEQADSKSIDSSRSTEEEDDDEDYAEAARTAAINQQIKRVLTEVLLKVTDQLFDEIATKVLEEDDLTVEVEHNTVTSSHKVLPSPLVVSTPKASAKVLVPVKEKESETEDVTEKSSSSSPGNVLGLANYASDEDDDDNETQSASMSNPKKNAVLQQSSLLKFSEPMHDVPENGSSQVQLRKNSREQTNLESDLGKTSSVDSKNKISASTSGLSGQTHSSKVVSEASDAEISVDGRKNVDSHNGLKSTLGENVVMKSELLVENDSMKKSEWLEKHPRSRADEKGDDHPRRWDEKHLRKERTDDQNGLKDRIKDRGDKTGEKAKESESRKRSSHLGVREDKKEAEKLHRATAKEDAVRKREWAKDKEEDRARHKLKSDSSRHKRQRSSSTSSRGRNSKDSGSSDEASEDSKRKLQSRKRHSSPSPDRSRRRQVSRSPHSKHSQRRHSPYSSLETTRGRRSRSKSPVRRRR